MLRRKPPGKLLPSAHAVEREFRVIRALHGVGFPVARPYVLCEDDGVIGTAFYIMDCVEGRVLWDQGLPGMEPAQRFAIWDELNRVIALLHTVDYRAVGLEGFGKEGSYLERQIARWSKQYRASETQKIEAMDNLIAWLPHNIPPGDETTIVHGDYRLGNLIFARSAPARVLAVLDWEMATIGDPLADAGYLAATYGEEGCPPSPLELSPVTRLRGFLTRQQLLLRYAERSGRAVDSLGWYQALALWKAAIFCEAIHTRWLNGERPGDMTFAPALETGVPVLLELAQRASA